jgi:DNA-binding beta-propeller fold protein YncE
LSFIGYPTGIAVYPGADGESNIFISDSYNHNVAKYLSKTSGEIDIEKQYIFPFSPFPYVVAVDVDSWGNVYVVDSYNHKITVLDSEITRVLAEFGAQGTGSGQFESPIDICINKNENQNEVVACEWWEQFSGIRCFKITSDPRSVRPPGLR